MLTYREIETDSVLEIKKKNQKEIKSSRYAFRVFEFEKNFLKELKKESAYNNSNNIKTTTREESKKFLENKTQAINQKETTYESLRSLTDDLKSS